MSSRHLEDMSSRHLPDISSRRLQDMSSRRLQDQQMFAGLFFVRRITKQLQPSKTGMKLFSRLLSLSRERDVDVHNVLSREPCVVPLDLFCLNGAVRYTAKSNLLNEIEIKRSSLPSLWGILILVQLVLISWQYY